MQKPWQVIHMAVIYSGQLFEKSPAEADFLSLFKEKAPANWVVIHSLMLKNHPNQREGEIDFVVISPDFGVLVIEVKGGSVSCENKQWFSIDRAEVKHEICDPFEQARGNAHALEDYLSKKGLPGIKVGYGVAFPDVAFRNQDTISYTPQMIFDLTNHQEIEKYVRSLAAYFQYQKHYPRIDNSIFSRAKSILTSEWNFQYVEPLASQIESDAKAMVQLTQSQLQIVEKLDFVKGIVVHGPAGTGKTLLAVECAKRMAKKGEKIALITWSLKLTDFLKKQLAKYENIDVFSLSDFFEKTALDKGYLVDGEFTDDIIKTPKHIKDFTFPEKDHFYGVVLPSIAIRILSDHPISYDRIIVDEAQDLRINYLLLLSLMEEKRIAGGKYIFFGDFVRQAVFDAAAYDGQFLMALKAMSADYDQIEITGNCRNPQMIVQELNRLSGIQPQNTDEQSEKLYRHYESSDDEANQVRKLLNQLLHNDRVSPSSITIIGGHRLTTEQNVCNKLANDFLIEEYSVDGNTPGAITYSTIRTFKGLENDVVIVVDMDTYKSKDILYVALSRAKSKIYIFEGETATLSRLEWYEDSRAK